VRIPGTAQQSYRAAQAILLCFPRRVAVQNTQGALQFMLQLFIVLKAITEVALMALIGQGIVALFAGANRDKNVVFQIFRIITGPPVQLTRLITPRFIIDGHVPFVTFFLFFWLWVGCVLGKAAYSPQPPAPPAPPAAQRSSVTTSRVFAALSLAVPRRQAA
jgi:hypothetical protein